MKLAMWVCAILLTTSMAYSQQPPILTTFGWFSVKEWGAKGDSTTDDTKSIQGAADQAYAMNGVLFFPPGAYKVSTTATIRSDVVAIGARIWKASGNAVTWADGMTTGTSFTFPAIVQQLHTLTYRLRTPYTPETPTDGIYIYATSGTSTNPDTLKCIDTQGNITILAP
jgi:polygalacturonase